MAQSHGDQGTSVPGGHHGGYDFHYFLTHLTTQHFLLYHQKAHSRTHCFKIQ